jgi:hypothetical protein
MGVHDNRTQVYVRDDAKAPEYAPDYLAHWVVKTARFKEMNTWYQTVFGAGVYTRTRTSRS